MMLRNMFVDVIDGREKREEVEQFVRKQASLPRMAR